MTTIKSRQGDAMRAIRIGVLFLGIVPLFGAQQSVQVTSAWPAHPAFTLPNTAPWTTIGLSTSPMRWELRVHDFGANFPAYSGWLMDLGPVSLLEGVRSGTIAASIVFGALDVVYNNGPQVGFVGGDILIRAQRDVVNSQYTLEVCSATGGNCASGTAPITTFGPPSWAGATLAFRVGGDFAFLRWFSSVVPVGTPIPSMGVVGNLGDWEFEGNLLDSSGHGNKFTGGTVAYSATPIYPPACNAGTQQTFRAGYPASLNGSGSSPLDGGTFLSYVWQLVSGPSTPIWSSHSSATPQIKGLVFGSYVFQLTVTDSSNQSSVCTVKDGAVATDDNGIVVTGNANVDLLLGPMVRYGANPWPWYDNRHMQAAVDENSIMNVYFPAWWDTPGPGTVTVTNYSTAVVGSGTSFTTTFCQGPANPTAPQAGYPTMAVWHPFGSGTGRRMYGVASCADDTHLTVGTPYNDDGQTLPGSGLTYAADNQYAPVWGWSQKNSPANYYDNVAAYYALYYRSGIDDYLTAARTFADRWWESPMIDQGALPQDYGFTATARSVSALGLVLRALDGRPDMWAGPSATDGASGLHHIWNHFMSYLTGYDATHGIYDTREVAYHLKMTAYCALFDSSPAYQSNCRTTIINSFPAIWTPTEFPDGSWPQMYHDQTSDGSWDFGGVTLTNGSAAVTALGTPGWTAAQFPSRIWFLNSLAWPINNSVGDPISYSVTFVDSKHLTLGGPYQGTSGTHGWELANGADSPITGWASEPFMTGILAEAFDFSAKAMEAVSPPTAASTATASLAHSYNVAAANWVKNYGYRTATKGLYYYVDGIECQPPISESNGICTSGMPADTSRTLSPEGSRGLTTAYAYTQDPALKAFIDTLYNAMFAPPATCPSGSTVCVPDGTYIDPMNDGQYMINVPPLASLGSATPWKYFGLFFGVTALSSWPGYRVGGVQPWAGEPMYIGANLPGVSGAAAIRVVTTAPSGATYTTNCSASPCAVTVDRRQGDHLSWIQYLSAAGAVLASSGVPLVGGQ
jgi:hypothetical protein